MILEATEEFSSAEKGQWKCLVFSIKSTKNEMVFAGKNLKNMISSTVSKMNTS